MSIKPAAGKRIRFVCKLLLSGLLIAVGICFIISCIQIYQSGDSPFTRAKIGEHFNHIAVLVYVTLFAIVGVSILFLFLPQEESKSKISVGSSDIVRRLSKSVSENRCNSSIFRERKKRRILTIINAVLHGIGIIIPLCYVLRTENFPAASINSEIAKGMLIILAGLAIPFVFSIVLIFVFKSSYQQEAELLRQVVAEDKKNGIPRKEKENSTKNKIRSQKLPAKLIVQCICIALGILFVVLGIQNGGMSAVVQKAIRICTECIGLG